MEAPRWSTPAAAVGAIIVIVTGEATMIMVTMTEIIDADQEYPRGER
jgi:hypothetical protein